MQVDRIGQTFIAGVIIVVAVLMLAAQTILAEADLIVLIYHS